MLFLIVLDTLPPTKVITSVNWKTEVINLKQNILSRQQCETIGSLRNKHMLLSINCKKCQNKFLFKTHNKNGIMTDISDFDIFIDIDTIQTTASQLTIDELVESELIPENDDILNDDDDVPMIDQKDLSKYHIIVCKNCKLLNCDKKEMLVNVINKCYEILLFMRSEARKIKFYRNYS